MFGAVYSIFCKQRAVYKIAFSYTGYPPLAARLTLTSDLIYSKLYFLRKYYSNEYFHTIVSEFQNILAQSGNINYWHTAFLYASSAKLKLGGIFPRYRLLESYYAKFRQIKKRQHAHSYNALCSSYSTTASVVVAAVAAVAAAAAVVVNELKICTPYHLHLVLVPVTRLKFGDTLWLDQANQQKPLQFCRISCSIYSNPHSQNGQGNSISADIGPSTRGLNWWYLVWRHWKKIHNMILR